MVYTAFLTSLAQVEVSALSALVSYADDCSPASVANRFMNRRGGSKSKTNANIGGCCRHAKEGVRVEVEARSTSIDVWTLHAFIAIPSNRLLAEATRRETFHGSGHIRLWNHNHFRGVGCSWDGLPTRFDWGFIVIPVS